MSRTPQVVIHIGLHKTGTPFIQRLVFRQLDQQNYLFNPHALWRSIRSACRNPGDQTLAEQAKAAVEAWGESGDERTLLLSEPHICGDMYSGYSNYLDNLPLIRTLFPEARIVFFVRDQADWLQSAYRQALAKDRPRPIEVFLNWYDGDFRPRIARRVHGVRNLDALGLQFLAIYRAYANAYGGQNVYLFQQEDLRQRPTEVRARLAEALGTPKLPEPPHERQQNRSYSALAIHLFHPSVNRRFPRPTAKDTGRRPRHLGKITGHLRRLRRVFIQHGFDRLYYRDWDLLARHGMRARLNEHYRAANTEIRRVAAIILDEGPGKLSSPDQDR